MVGLDGYFTLTDQNNPTLSQLISAWTSNRFGENLVAAVQNFANSRQKPVIFTEIGYKSTDGTNREPWNFGLSGALDTAEQRDCYEAAFTVWSQQSSWMKGFFWWAWPVPAPAANDTDYNPRSKPAETVLRTWQGPGGNPNFTLSANPSSLTVNRGASVTSAITITRSGGFTSGVGLSATGLPGGVTATFNPASTTGGSSTLTLAASSTAATGMVNVTINGAGGGLTRAVSLSLTVNADSGTGGATVTPAINANSPWYNEEVIRLNNTANITALSITITIQRTTGIGFNGTKAERGIEAALTLQCFDPLTLCPFVLSKLNRGKYDIAEKFSLHGSLQHTRTRAGVRQFFRDHTHGRRGRVHRDHDAGDSSAEGPISRGGSQFAQR